MDTFPELAAKVGAAPTPRKKTPSKAQAAKAPSPSPSKMPAPSPSPLKFSGFSGTVCGFKLQKCALHFSYPCNRNLVITVRIPSCVKLGTVR